MIVVFVTDFSIFLFLPNLSNLGRVVKLLEGNQSVFLACL